MKLVEILAKELREWPEGVDGIFQDYDRELRYIGWDASSLTGIRPDDLAEDCRERGEPHPCSVTREMWEAERAKLTEWKGRPDDPIKNFKCTVVPVGFLPDWPEAPEWAHSFGLVGPASAAVWFNDEQYSYMGARKEFKFDQEGCRAMSDIHSAIHRPSKPQWNGEGLRSVGVQVMFEGNQCEVVGYHDGMVVCAMDDDYENGCYDGFAPQHLRPTRTDREKWIEAARKACAGYVAEVEIGRIYDTMIAKLPEDGE